MNDLLINNTSEAVTFNTNTTDSTNIKILLEKILGRISNTDII